MNQTKEQATVTDTDLAKSVAGLMALLETESPTTEQVDAEAEGMAKSMSMNHATMPTNGGLAAATGAPPLDQQLDQTMAQPEGELDDLDQFEEDLNQYHLNGDSLMGKSLVDDAPELDSDDEFAKSLATAFIENEVLAEAAQQSEFAKSLVVGTIEGLSIANEEIQKSLAGIEARQDEKIKVLAKGIAAIANAIGDIRAQMQAGDNTPVRTVAKSARVLEKSFGAPSAEANPDMIKSLVLNALEKRVQDGKADAFTLVKYETTGVLDSALARDIQSELGL